MNLEFELPQGVHSFRLTSQTGDQKRDHHMQNTIISNGSANWSEHLDDGAQSRNLAAIALAEAMHRARMMPHAEARVAGAQPTPSLSSKARLDVLRKKLKPLYDAIPQDVEGVDLGVVREDKPRLFLDMISFIDVSEESKKFRLIKGGRNGPQVLHETSDETALISRITDYIAERLIVRERILDQGDPVVVGAAHFSRGVTAGIGVHSQSIAPSAEPVVAPVVAAAQFLEVKQAAVHETVKAESLAEAKIEKTPVEEIAPRKVFSQPAQAMPHQTAPMSTTTTIKPAVSPTASRATSSVTRGWWLWPTLAMIIGMGFAAYLLYLYSMSFAS
jgi:hypothetical protein